MPTTETTAPAVTNTISAAIVNIIVKQDNNDYQKRADVNNDGKITIADALEVVNIILGR